MKLASLQAISLLFNRIQSFHQLLSIAGIFSLSFGEPSWRTIVNKMVHEYPTPQTHIFCSLLPLFLGRTTPTLFNSQWTRFHLLTSWAIHTAMIASTTVELWDKRNRVRPGLTNLHYYFCRRKFERFLRYFNSGCTQKWMSSRFL